MLGNVADQPREPGAVQLCDRAAADGNVPTVRVNEAKQTADQGGFSRTVGADDGDALTRASLQAGLVEQRGRADIQAQAGCPDDVFRLALHVGSGMVQGSDGSGMVPAWFRDGSGMVQGWFKVSYKICVNLYCSRRSFAFGQ